MVIVYFKQLVYDGKEWKVEVPITVPEQAVTAGTDTTIFTPSAGFAVLDIEITDTSGVNNAVTIKDGTTVVKTITVPANGTVTLSGIVIKNSLVINAGGNAIVFVKGKDYVELIE